MRIVKKLIGKLRQRARSAGERRIARGRMSLNAQYNLAQRRRAEDLNPLDIFFYQVVNRLTNWQRSQWAQAGYPGLSQPTRRDSDKVLPFTDMKKTKTK